MVIFDLLILCIKKIYLLKSYIGMVADAFAKKLYFPIGGSSEYYFPLYYM